MGFWAKRLHQKFSPGRAKYVGGLPQSEAFSEPKLAVSYFSLNVTD
jgi:hypothetical protein